MRSALFTKFHIASLLMPLLGVGLFISTGMAQIIPQAPNLKNSKGQPIGKWIIWYDQSWTETKQLHYTQFYRIAEYDAEGNILGLTRDYFRSGKVQMEASFVRKDGKEINHGLCTRYFENGQIADQASYVDGKQEGVYKLWRKDGSLRGKIIYQKGNWHGKAMAYPTDKDSIAIDFIKNDIEPFHRLKEYIKSKQPVETAIIRQLCEEIDLSAAVIFDSNFRVSVINILARFLSDRGYTELAETNYKRCIDIQEKEHGKDNFKYAYALTELAFFYERTGYYEKSFFLYKSSTDIMGRISGKQGSNYAIIANNEALCYYKTGFNLKALPIFQEVLQIREQNLGKQNSIYAASLINLSNTYTNLNQYDIALSLCLEALQILEHSVGKNVADYANALNSLANLYYNQGQYDKALALFQQAVKVSESIPNEKSTIKYTTYLTNFADTYIKQKQFDKAFALYQQVLQIREQLVGKNHIDYASSLNGLADLYYAQDQYDKALPLYQQAVQISESILNGKSTLKYTTYVTNVALIYVKQKQSDKAFALYQQVLQIREQLVGKNHADYASSLNNLADLYYEQDQYDKALPLYQQAVQISESILNGKSTVAYTSYLTNVADVYEDLEQYEKALPLRKQVLQIREQILGKYNYEYTFALNWLANTYKSLGFFDKALPLYLEDLTTTGKLEGSYTADYATSLSDLSELYESMGQYAKALPLCEQALNIRGKILGKENINYTTSLFNLASIYESMKLYDKALPLCLEDLAVTEKLKQGKNNIDYSISLEKLATLYKQMGLYEKALPLYLEALEIYEEAKSNQTLDYASFLSDLADLYERTGKYEKALPLYLQDLVITERIQGKQHPDYATSLNDLAYLYNKMENNQKTVPLFLTARQIYKDHLLANLAILSESAIENYKSTFSQTALAYSIAMDYQSPELWGQNYNDALLSKSLGLVTIKNLRKRIMDSNDSTILNTYGHYQRLKHQLNRYYTTSPKLRLQIDSLEQKSEELEQVLRMRVPIDKEIISELKTEWPQVQQHLNHNEAAIEFVQFRYYNKRWTDSTYYAALVLRPGWKSPRLVYLCEKKQLDSLVGKGYTAKRQTAYVERLYSGNRGVIAATAGVRPMGLTRCYELVWQPLDSLLIGVSHVYYSSSGLLHRLNFAALPITKTERLRDHYQLTQLGSTRQLAIVENRSTEYANNSLLFGDITYDLDSTKYKKANSNFRSVTQTKDKLSVVENEGNYNEYWGPLVKTGQEIDEIYNLLDEANYKPIKLKGLQASEDAFYYYTFPTKPSQRIIHIASHGYFSDAPPKPKPDEKFVLNEKEPIYKLSDNPLVRSGLILAGGNQVWQGKMRQPGDEDGILTAYEISLLNLTKTELVVLSACETGLGDINASEGVYGLQRAFKMAGVKNLIVSLWQVNDNSTQTFMTAFYSYYLRDKLSVRQSFEKTVDSMKARYEEPFFWAGFVLIE